MKIRQSLRAVVTGAVGMSLLLVPLEASADTAAPGWADPVPGFSGLTDWMVDGCGPNTDYRDDQVHMGSDYDVPDGTSIRSIGDGTARFLGDVGGIDEALQVRHEVDGKVFYAIYGHIDARAKFAAGVIDVPVSANEVLGTVREYPGTERTDHLHFGVWEGTFPKSGSWGTRDCVAGEPPVLTSNNLFFKPPIPFLEANPGTYDPDDPEPGPGTDPTPEPELQDYFIDDDGSIFEDGHNWMAANGITRGCNPPTNNRYCGDDNVTRGQMAAFLNRALGLDPAEDNTFTDDDSSIFEADIQALAAADITRGCNPPTNNRFCPDGEVTRGQMAAFLARALSLPASATDSFVDDDSSIFEDDIQALAAAGITLGCNPPTNNRFCPDDPVTRSQMAAFLQRAAD